MVFRLFLVFWQVFVVVVFTVTSNVLTNCLI